MRWRSFWSSRPETTAGSRRRRRIEGLEAASIARFGRGSAGRLSSGADIALGVHGYDPVNPTDPAAPPDPDQLLTTSDVQALLQRAAAAVESATMPSSPSSIGTERSSACGSRAASRRQITGNTTNLVFAIDGAVSLARTGAYFGNDAAPLTSRTIQEISQTTITQREVDVQPRRPRSQR